MKITPEYIELNKQLHATGNYGVSASEWVESTLQLCTFVGSRDILDYGCGQRMLEKGLGFPIHNYDPCIAGVDDPPQPADIVVCTDVLEHIEPECLDDVLDDLQRLTLKVGLFVIANRPAAKVLADGRNAHLIQEDKNWWLPRLAQRFTIHQIGGNHEEIIFVVRKELASRTTA